MISSVLRNRPVRRNRSRRANTSYVLRSIALGRSTASLEGGGAAPRDHTNSYVDGEAEDRSARQFCPVRLSE